MNDALHQEIYMHSFLLTNELYKNKDVFVVHAHPPNIISYMGFNDHRELNTIKNIFPELNVGNIGKNVNYHDAGTISLAKNCYDNLLRNDLVGLEDTVLYRLELTVMKLLKALKQ